MTGFTVRAALFLLLFNVVMLFIVPFRTAEWYVTVFSVILMTVLLAVIRIGAAVRKRRETGCEHEKEQES